jgi:hypothetical protein
MRTRDSGGGRNQTLAHDRVIHPTDCAEQAACEDANISL